MERGRDVRRRRQDRSGDVLDELAEEILRGGGTVGRSMVVPPLAVRRGEESRLLKRIMMEETGDDRQ
jgi:hypothetical protein